MPYYFRRKTNMQHSAQSHSIDNAPRASTKRREPARSAREKNERKERKGTSISPFHNLHHFLLSVNEPTPGVYFHTRARRCL